MLLRRPIRTRFRYGFPTRVNLATQRKLAGSFFKRHAVTHHKDELQRIVGTRFQVLFHSPPGVLFTFPSRYLSAIGHQGVFRLSGWSRQIRTGFQGSRATRDDTREPLPYVYGGITHYAGPSQVLRLTTTLSDSLLVRQNQPNGPTTPDTQRLPAITRMWFGLFRFRSPLLTESLLLSLPVGTEMFHFPTFPLPALYIQAGVTGSHKYAQRGFPIRKSSDQSSIISSPRLIADLYVLLRLQMPRHPPFALRNLKSHEFDRIRCNTPKGCCEIDQ